jgi:hypothetical protein
MFYDYMETIDFGWKSFGVYFEIIFLFEKSVCDCGKKTMFKVKINIVQILDSEAMIEVCVDSNLGKRISLKTKNRLEKAICSSCSLKDVTESYSESFLDNNTF